MSETTEPAFQPRSEFVRTETNPKSYALVALNGTDTLRCHHISPTALSALREVFGEEMRLYGENAESEVAEFVFRNSPWSSKSIRSETLLTNVFAVLLVHQYTFLTTIDYGRQYLDKLSLTFIRPTSISNPTPATESIFALSFTAPSILRVVAAPLHATPAILQTVRGAWPRGVKSERKLGNGSWEFRLRGFGYFSAEKSDEAVLPHVFTLLRALDAHAFKLLAALPIGGRSRAKDLWLFTAPGASRPGRNSPGGSASVQGTITSNGPTSPGYAATIESSEPYSPGPFSAHAKLATDEPERAVPMASGHTKSPSLPENGSITSRHRKPAPAFVPSPNGSPTVTSPSSPGPMAMPMPMVAQPAPISPASPTSPLASPSSASAPLASPSSPSAPAPVPVPIPTKRNSSLLRKFRAGGSGRTASGGFKHPPPPPGYKPNGGSVNGKSDTGSIGKSAGGSVKGGSIGKATGGSVGKRGSANGSFGKRGHGRQRSLASGEIIYETPTPSPNPSPNPFLSGSPAAGPVPNGVAVPVSPSMPVPVLPVSPVGPSPASPTFVAPPPPPPIPLSPTTAVPQSPIVTIPDHQVAPLAMPVPVITTTSPTSTAPSFSPRPDMLAVGANRTTEELLLPRTAFRDSAFSTNTDLSHDVAVVWTGGAAGPGDLGGVKEEVDEVEARSPDVTREDEKRPMSEKAELAIVEPGPPPPLPARKAQEPQPVAGKPVGGTEAGETEKEKEKEKGQHSKQPSKSGSTPNEWVFVSVDKSKSASEGSGSPPEETPKIDSPPPPEPTRKGSFKRWFGGGGGAKTNAPKSKPKRRRGGMVQALRSSKRLTIE
ncbi:hypothetical protein FRC12_016700 [Ceratobasidium sp. 428]|nr:hypothetical protein FRC12_016700 [Ceratobasidium sp. 428]